ncbi:XRE family transcriptional regulator [Caulobacter sp. NIBR2454]|uniref:XRE family transcriptional regulator n=1 Tax=Caulobacter sp. NIBR2454 TaxID=3015996 RepID=UPI0022B6ACA6|nr:XRE family transcriptional regulator [Caulobacter sp. NIBR2454]
MASDGEKISAYEYLRGEALREIGAKIRAAREERGLSQAALAGMVSTTQQTIDRLERGKSKQSRYRDHVLRVLELPLPTEQEVNAIAIGEAHRRERLISKAALSDLSSGRTIPHVQEIPVYKLEYSSEKTGALRRPWTPVDYLTRPQPLFRVEGAYGLIVLSGAMEPSMFEGDTALVNPHIVPRPRNEIILIGEDDDNSGNEILLRSFVSQDAREWSVSSPSGGAAETLSKDDWPECHVIVGKFTRI